LTIIVHHSLGHLCSGRSSELLLSPSWLDNLGGVVLTALWLPDRLNHEAVLFFFVLSGFCIHYRAAQDKERGLNGLLRWREFYARRFLRLLPPLLVALLLTLACDALSHALLISAPSSPSGSPQMRAALSASYRDPAGFLGNLFLLMPFFVTPYGSNWPLWALGYEAWYYLLYPAFRGLSGRFGGQVGLGFALGLSAFGVMFIRGTDFPLYPVMSTWWVWCLGAFLAEVRVESCWKNRLNAASFRLILPAGVVAMTVLTRWPPEHSLVTYSIWAPILGLLIYRLSLIETRKWQLLTRAFGSIGRFSYSLYIVQMPLLVLIASLWLYVFGSLPVAPWLSLAAVIAVLPVGWLMAIMVERPLHSRPIMSPQGKPKFG
jgi:peptidoglycan/LPS O-acetylase OafA/YrhL